LLVAAEARCVHADKRARSSIMERGSERALGGTKRYGHVVRPSSMRSFNRRTWKLQVNGGLSGLRKPCR